MACAGARQGKLPCSGGQGGFAAHAGVGGAGPHDLSRLRLASWSFTPQSSFWLAANMRASTCGAQKGWTGRSVTAVWFIWLTGALHYLSEARALAGPGKGEEQIR